MIDEEDLVGRGDSRRGTPVPEHFYALDSDVDMILADNRELKAAVRRLTQVATGVLVSLLITSATLLLNSVHT